MLLPSQPLMTCLVPAASPSAGLGILILADDDVRIAREGVRGDREILRRRHALEHPARDVVLGPVARAVEAARPVVAEIDARDLRGIRGLEGAERRAAEVRADRIAHPVLRISR